MRHSKFTKKRVALVYDRVNKWGGAERVLLALHDMFPEAPLYTSVYDRKKAAWAKIFPKIYTSFLQRIPFAKSNHEFLAPLMPLAFGSFNFNKYDLVISVTSEAAKGIRTNSRTKHICYCLTPTRYLWSHYEEYFKNQFFKSITKPIIYILREWDKGISQRPHFIIAISTEVQKRIKKYYDRESKIIFPPVSLEKKQKLNSKNKKRDYFLVVSRLINYYKKVDLVIESFNNLGFPLVIIGTGRDEVRLRSIAKKNVEFVGKVSDKKLINYYKNAKAFIMPQEEDFGIVAVEAQSYGVPVIAYTKGGAQDTVIDGKTGIYFKKQTAKSLTTAIKKFDEMKFNKSELYKNSQRFSEIKFKKQFLDLVKKVLE